MFQSFDKKRLVDFLNKYSLVFHFILSSMICLGIESASRHSLFKALRFMFGKPTVFLYNSLIVFTTFLIVYLFKKRMQIRITLTAIWLFLGIINGCVLAARVTPFNFADIKLVGDLFAMKSNYFTVTQAALVIGGVVLFIAIDILLFVKGPSYKGSVHRFVAALSVASAFVWLPVVTEAAVHTNVITDYFENIAAGYMDYGFVYGFSSSVVDRGMKKPENYSEATIDQINEETASNLEKTDTKKPNVILVLLESFIDPSEVNYLNCSTDPIPTFHKYEKQFSSGYLNVPVVGAGTANTEFEVLTGMSMRYFGTGEYPYKTILKSQSCESTAGILKDNGYKTHVVHNNSAKFYSRNNAFAKMGFDSFTSKEFMNINEYTPLGTWPTDNILVSEVEKALDTTADPDYVYTITVQGHGAYPTEKIIENPLVTVTGAETEEKNNAWEYYVNQIHEVDQFIADLTEMLNQRDEDSIVVMFGDHLPSMDLSDDDMKSNTIFHTKYITWNNMGLEKDDAELTSYQLMSKTLNDIGIHDGTIIGYHQANMDKSYSDENYQSDLENLQYDLLYGDRFTYKGQDLYPESDLEMGVKDILLKRCVVRSKEEVKQFEMMRALSVSANDILETTISDNSISMDSISEDSVSKNSADSKYTDRLYVYGANFTPWSKVFVNGDKISTQFISDRVISVKMSDLDVNAEEANHIVVNQMGGSTILRSSNEILIELPIEE